MSEFAPTRVDLHVKTLDERVVERAKARGLDALIYAPHFTRLSEIRARAERFAEEGLAVVPAREVFTGDWRSRRHVLAVGLDDPVPDFISFDGALREFERQGAAVLAPHPTLFNVSLSRADTFAHDDRIDAVETYNPKCPPSYNRRAQRIARAADLPAYGSSYAHVRSSVGEVWTRFDGDVRSEAALVEALKADAPRRVVRRSGLAHEVHRIAEFAHLGYENTWEKIDRLLLSGAEPTHPERAAYGGRFDDVTVY